MNTAIAAWTKIWSRSPLRTATMPAIPPRKMYAVNSTDEPFTVPPMIAIDRDDDRRDRGIEQDRQEHPDRSGRDEELEDGSAGGDLEGQRGADEEHPDEHQDVVAVPEARPESPHPGEQHPDDQHGEQEPAAEARDVDDVLAEPRATIFSMSAPVRRSPLRTMTSFWTMSTMIGATAASAASRAVSVA